MTTAVKTVLYTAEALVEGGRDGHARSSDCHLDVELDVPIELEGEGGSGTNPEQLFAAGYSSCFHSALKLVAQRMKLDAEGSTVTARVGIGPIEGSPGFGLTVELDVALPGVPDAEQAEQLLERSHKVCPYSNAINGNVEVALKIV
jgi:lipoyl-dependent peroxiredoxin